MLLTVLSLVPCCFVMDLIWITCYPGKNSVDDYGTIRPFLGCGGLGIHGYLGNFVKDFVFDWLTHLNFSGCQRNALY